MCRQLIVLLFILFYSSVQGQERRVSVTIDDLPGTDNSYDYVMTKLTTFFEESDIPVTGFVNEVKLYDQNKLVKERVDLLQDWINKDLDLGNHTYSHVFINETDLSVYKADILKGEKVIRALLENEQKKLKYFRHTQLRTGPTENYRFALDKFLVENSYITAPVTIDNNEYIYAFCYQKADTNLKKRIAQDYLSYMEKVILYYENLSVNYLGYELPQILLIHANELNADHIDKLISIFKTRDYDFITLDEALTDDAYSLPEGTHQRGISWIHRWMIEDNIPPPPQSEISVFISELYQKMLSQ